jgi:hypothetical protein
MDLAASHPAREVGGRRGAARVGKEGDVVDLRALLGAAIEPVGKLQGRQADPELTLERLTQAEVGGERKRGDQLGEADTILGCGSHHGAESLVGPGGAVTVGLCAARAVAIGLTAMARSPRVWGGGPTAASRGHATREPLGPRRSSGLPV